MRIAVIVTGLLGATAAAAAADPDPCPFTARDATEILPGCSLADVVHDPAVALAPARVQLGAAAHHQGSLREVDARGPLAQIGAALDAAEAALGEGRVCDAAAALDQIDAAEGAIGEALAAAEAGARGGVRPEEDDDDGPGGDPYRLVRAIQLRGQLGLAALDQVVAAGAPIGESCREARASIEVAGRVIRVDDRSDRVELDSGAVVTLPGAAGGRAGVVPGASVRIVGTAFADGTLLGSAATSDTVMQPPAGGLGLIDCATLRVVPLQQGYPGYSGWTVPAYHDLRGYRDDDKVLQLERGAGLAIDRSWNFAACPAMTADGKAIHYAATIRYGAGLSKTLASNLEPDAIVIAKDAGQPNTPLPLRVTYYTQACSVWGLGSCDAPVEIGSDDFTYVLWAAEEAGATAVYDRTTVGILHNNDPGDHEWLLLDGWKELHPGIAPATVATITGQGFLVDGLDIVAGPIPQGHQFMIFESDVTDIWADPALPSWSSRYAVGQDRPGGLTWPRIEGERNGQPYWYSVAQPHVTRDRIAVCPTLAGGNLTTANGKSGMVQAVGDAFYEMPYTCGEDTDIVKGNIDDPSKYHGWNQVAAIDIPKSTGTKITAARGGIVYEFEESLDCNGDCGGNYIIIRHQDGSYGVYYHLVQDGVLVTDGQLVRRGQSIAKTGNTGKSGGPHVHFEPASEPTSDWKGVRSRYRAMVDGELETCYLPRVGDDIDSASVWPNAL